MAWLPVIGCAVAAGLWAAPLPGQHLERSSEVPAQLVESVRIVDSIDETRLTTLKGNTHPLAQPSFDRGRVSPDLLLGDLVLVLRRSPAQQAAFDAFVASQYNRNSPNYHLWLTAEQIAERFGSSGSDLQAVSNWLSGHGLSVDAVASDGMSIRFSGTAAQVESAFHTEIHTFVRNGERHVANMSDPRIPVALAPVVVGVKALHNFFPRPMHRLGSAVARDAQSGGWRRVTGQTDSAGRPVASTAEGRVKPQFGTANPYGDVVEDVAPYDFAKIYNVLPEWTASSPIDGAGQTIAIAGTSNIYLADVAAFRSAFGLPAKAPSVVITNSDPGACPGFASSCADDLVENTLDVEWSGAVAKGANIVLVTSSAPTSTSDPLFLSEDYIVQHKTASIMNVSYGSCELALGTAGNTEYNNLWQTAASEGIAVFVASGDAGSPACDQGFDAIYGVPYQAQFGLAVNGIASTPYNTAVGGTDLNWGATAAPYWNASNGTGLSSAAGYIPEVPWNSTCVNALVLPALQSDASYIGVSGVVDAESACNFVIESGAYIQSNFGVNLAPLVDTIGGGGGASNCTVSGSANPESCSGHYTKPSWQAGVAGIPADGARDVPDVVFFASNGFLGSSYLICVSEAGSACTYSATQEPTAQEVGGTSVASPAMAGVMALINQRSGGPQGNPNAQLYQLAAEQNYAECSAETVTATSASCVFNDIDTGTNAMACVNPALQESPNCAVLYTGDPAGILTGFSAGTGYDQATGLGSLNVANAVNSWPAIAPYAGLSPTELTFAATSEGFASASQVVTLKNSGKAALSLSGTGHGIAIAGTNAASFTQTNTCGTTVAAGASCTVTVIFKPAAIGALTASLSFADNAFGSPQLVALSGTGIAPAPVATLSAQSLSFNSTAAGSTNTAPSITLTNSGTAALAIAGISFVGANPTAFTETNTCGSSLASGASCGIVITFKPLVAGTLTATLDVADNASGSPQTLALSGTATGGAPAVSLSPASLTFASATVGSTSAAQVVTVKNTGTAAATLTSETLTGTNSSSYLISANTCGTSLAPSATCAVSVEFKPTAAGTLTGSLSVADNATGTPQTVALTGTGTAASTATVSLSPSSLTFAATNVGATSAAQVIAIQNTGTTAVTVKSYAFTGTNASEFLLTAKTCSTSLAAGASCTLSIAFKPTAAGAATASLAATDSASGSPQTVALTGTGAMPATLSLTPSTLTFASTNVGATSASQVITVANTGTTAITVKSYAFTGTNASEFLLSAKTCSTSLAAGASCTLSIEFKPTASGAATASLVATDSATGSPQTVALTGTGASPATLSLTPSTLTFASTNVGATSASQVIAIENTSTVAITVKSYAFSGTNASEFLLTAKTCSTSLAAGASCTLSVAFKPMAAGAATASLVATDSASGSPQSVPLTGTGN